MKERLPPLLIRADASAQIGIGHVMRCLALAQAWKDQGGKVTFLSHCKSEKLRQLIFKEGFDFVSVEKPHPSSGDLKQTLQLLSDILHGPSREDCWFVMDGYHFDTTFQRTIKDTGLRVLVIDDMADLPHYYADIVLNQNIHADGLSYSCEPYAKLLLGTKYVLLRREFLKWREWKREVPDVARKILVILGGSDPDNVTLRVIQAIGKIDMPDIDVKVILGPSNPHRKCLEGAIVSTTCSTSLLENVHNMPELMAWADIAVSAGGSTCWELAFMGLPNVILIFAENQRAIAEKLDEAGVAVNLGWHQEVKTDKIARILKLIMPKKEARAEMSSRGRALVEGTGVLQVCHYLLKNST